MNRNSPSPTRCGGGVTREKPEGRSGITKISQKFTPRHHARCPETEIIHDVIGMIISQPRFHLREQMGDFLLLEKAPSRI